MTQYPPELQLIVHNLEHFHTITALEIECIHSAHSFVAEASGRLSDDQLLVHSIKVAEYIASWRFDHTVVIAAMLHRVVAHYDNIFEQSTLHINESTANILKGYIDIHQQITEATLECTLSSQGKKHIQPISLYPESFYILIAEHIVMLSSKQANVDDNTLLLAQQTREIIIPQVKRINAYKMVDMLEELCFQIEKNTIYLQICSVIEQIEVLSCYYRKQFTTRLHHIFDPHSNILPTTLKKLQPYIKLFSENKRSLVSIYRFITKADSVFASETSINDDMEKIKNVYRTAYYDLTLVIDDDFLRQGDLTTIDLFLEYYDQMLRPDGVYLYGFYPTTSKDSYYFLLSDPMKNMYRFFIKSESEYLYFLYGDIINREKYEIINEPHKSKSKIKIFRRDGSPDFVEKGTTVLDFAFKIHEDLGLHFDHAKLNNNDKAMPPYTVINNGDTVEIVKSHRITAELNWFRYVKTETALNYLIKYYKTQYLQSGGMIRVAKSNGESFLLQAGSTVLDFAFAVHRELGLYFSYALINGQKNHFSVDHILANGDTVTIVTTHTVQANYDWFRHTVTTTATNFLIDYFKQVNQQ